MTIAYDTGRSGRDVSAKLSKTERPQLEFNTYLFAACNHRNIVRLKNWLKTISLADC